MYRGIVVEYSKTSKIKCEMDKGLRKLSVIWIGKGGTYCRETFIGVDANKAGSQIQSDFDIAISHYELGEIVMVDDMGHIHKLPGLNVFHGENPELYRLLHEYLVDVKYELASITDEDERMAIDRGFRKLIRAIWFPQQEPSEKRYRVRVLRDKKR